MKQKLTLVFCLLLAGISGFAQTDNSPKKGSLIGFHYTLVDYISPDRIKATSVSDVFKQGDIFNANKMSTAITLSYWKGLTNHIDLSVKFNGIWYSYYLNTHPTAQPYNNEFGAELEAAANIRPVTDNHFFSPFLTVGIGGGNYTNQAGAYIPLGLGLQFNLNSTAYILLQTQYRKSLTEKIFPDNLLHSLGIAVNIGRERPIAPAAVELPIVVVKDRDGDGVVDSLDECPDVAGPAALKGCPDRDGDGIPDKDDACPDVPGTAKYHGCPIPDTDKDGINDEEDKCPNVPGVARYQGCPIPDTDGDGVNDEEDKCPNEPGTAANFGCPEIKKEVIERINKAAHNIYFATGSAKLLAKSNASLNAVVKELNDNPTYRVDIGGHTDITGTAEKNQVLSEARANSVKNYLLGKGVDTTRLTATGYGITVPIADNKTAAGRSKNRRVELKLRNY